ncbi:MAG TPA: trehalose-6-phosphate synthase [Candidatus Saccharimonadales bacterium]|nr:trehalose-6-phosphate synthase [Candidatus Saccharimonadales bacterium]
MSVRLIISLILCITLVSLFFSYYEVRSEKVTLRRDLERRAEMLAETVAGNVTPYLDNQSPRDLQPMIEQIGHRQQLTAVAIYDTAAEPVFISAEIVRPLRTAQSAVTARAMAEDRGQSQFLRTGNSYFHIYALPLRNHEVVTGGLAIVHDAGYIDRQTNRRWRSGFVRSLVQVLLIALTILLIVRWSVVGPIARAAKWMNALRTGKLGSGRNVIPDLELLRPLAYEMATFAASLEAARSSAQKEAQLRDAAESLWTAERLSVHVRGKMNGGRLFVVSNREPYIHVRQGKSVQAVQPASGLVTALEPVLCACDGHWIAHGSGEADRETVDNRNCLRVPPDESRYTLRRVWLTKEEEEGYYYGFANEGMWPLCHIAHTRPIFRASDWQCYQEVNEKFAQAVLQEMNGVKHPLLLAQDYHFALLPQLIKKRRPDARIAIFWHIPWPNPEAFGICPWQRQLLQGLLGADLIGFHIQSHCTNFMQTVDRALECRIDWEHRSINREEHQTLIKPFPISVEFNEGPPELGSQESRKVERTALLRELGIEAVALGVGVDRVDYTKGIPERFLAVERLLEKYPQYQGKFTLVQIGAPSRTHIKRYHDLLAEVESEAERINWRFQSGKWKPIVFLKRQHTHTEIRRFYRAADLCLVTSLHDGMNLVAKEFVAERRDEQGVLVLSRFTGAARELRDALVVNPYDIERTSDTIRLALAMEPAEQASRMQALRKVVRERNVYRWAGNLLADLCEVREERPAELEAVPKAGVA